jgi:membrane protease subunit HflC
MKKSLLLLILLAIGLIVALNGLFTVRETEQAMVLRFGRVDRVVAEPGLHFKLPFIQQLLFFDKRIMETDSAPEELQTLNKKRVVVDSFTRWRIVDVKKFYEAVRTENTALSRLNPIVNSAIRNIVARETLEELVSGNRSRLMADIKAEASREATPFGIEIVDVRIKRADLPEANSRAVFLRMRAEREKEAKEIRAKGAEEAQIIRADAEKQRTIMLAEAERDAQKLRGEGDGEAIKITGKAFNQDRRFYSFLRSLEAYANSLNKGTIVVLDPSVEFLETFGGE